MALKIKPLADRVVVEPAEAEDVPQAVLSTRYSARKAPAGESDGCWSR